MRKFAYLILCFALGCAPSAIASQAAGLWLDVPFVKQMENGCGAGVLSMLMQYWSIHGAAVSSDQADLQAIQKALYIPKKHGILASDMARYLKKSGFRAFSFRGQWSDFQEHVAKGRPLIISVRPGRHASFHYVLVVGVDYERNAVFLNDPARGKLLRVERQDIEKEWSAAGNWALLAVPASGG